MCYRARALRGTVPRRARPFPRRWGWQEVHHPDGKTERVYADGRKSVGFANGTRKEVLSPNVGGGTVVFFVNGDIKRTYLDNGRIDYYYAEVDTVRNPACPPLAPSEAGG